MQVRSYDPAEAGALAGVFFRAVREGALGLYSAAQVAAWAPEEPTAATWQARLRGLETVVAEDAGGIAGFMSLNMKDGYLDLAFVAPEWRGQGVAAGLYAVLESRARRNRMQRLHTQASHLARPFFRKEGWADIAPNTVERCGVSIPNWHMEKHLTPLV